MRFVSACGEPLERSRGRRALAVALVCALAWPAAGVRAQAAPPPPAQPTTQSPPPSPPGGEAHATPLNAEQLEALVAPIALFPDALLSQALMASTYPLEIIQATQWVAKNGNLKGEELEKAVQAQAWDPSVQATAMMPDLLKRLAEDITWTTNLGNAFLGQPQDVMTAVQLMRKRAKESGKLESNEKMTVETQVVEQQTVVVIQPANPQVIYVPAYNPTVIWGPPVYPYPPVYYPPPPPPGAMLFTFTAGMMWGAAIRGGPCCSCGWGGNNTVIINNNNNFVRHYNNTNNIRTGGGQSNWQHNPQHRGGAPYGDRATAERYGGGGGRGGGAQGRPSASPSDRSGAGPATANRGGTGPSTANRGGTGPSTANRGGGAPPTGNRAGTGPSTANRGGAGTAAPSYGGGGGAGIGHRSVQDSPGGSAFGGAGGGADRTRASGSRGASSMPQGGGRGGGGGRGR